jgi:hypothetical protein
MWKAASQLGVRELVLSGLLVTASVGPTHRMNSTPRGQLTVSR